MVTSFFILFLLDCRGSFSPAEHYPEASLL